MGTRNDETLQVFIDESLEHLAHIENDLLAIEAAGADIDEERVNKVFRAAHSIKGGAGFMNLANIKELAHTMENVLGMIRDRRMVPNPENIHVLLLAADTLRELIEDVGTSEERDISEYTDGLSAIAEGALLRQPSGSTQEPTGEPVAEEIEISPPNLPSVLRVAHDRISQARDEGKFIYLIEIDSRPGEGMAILIKLPLTLAIIPSQITLNEGERYAIPQVNLGELMRIPAGKIKDQIEIVGDVEVVRLRGSLLPLVRLSSSWTCTCRRWTGWKRPGSSAVLRN